MMKQKQYAFAATIATRDSVSRHKMNVKHEDEDLCIICRCDDTEGENNGPIGYLGHVQRSRYAERRLVCVWYAVVNNLEERLGLQKGGILYVKDGKSGDAAVQLAFGETQIIGENPRYSW